MSALLHLLDLAPADRSLDIIPGVGIIFELSQIIRYWFGSLKAGIRDGRTLALSIREGSFVSIPEKASL